MSARLGLVRVDAVTYVCARCDARAALMDAIRRNDADAARFIVSVSPGAHAPDCGAARAPMFTLDA